MNKQSVLEFLIDGFSLAKLPDSFLRLREIANNPHSDLEDVVEVVRGDAGLAASLLKLANSSAYNSGEAVNSIEDAAQLLGLRRVVESSLALGIVKEIQVDAAHFDILCFWRRSITVADIAEGVFERMPAYLQSRIDRGSVYTAGLLHDIGLLALMQGFATEVVEVVDKAIASNISLHEAESQLFGFSHQDVGRILFKKWGLPPELQAAAGYHHAPLEVTRRLFSPLVDLIYMADFISSSLSEQNPTVHKPLLYDQVWLRSGVGLDLVDTLGDRVQAAAQSAELILAC